MIRFFLSVVLYLAANAVGLLVATLVLEDMSLDGRSFLLAVGIFTAVEVTAQPVLTKVAMQHARAMIGSTALVATLVGLVVTAVVSDGLRIDGALTWALASVTVWAAALVAGIILPALFVKRVVEEARGRRS